MERTLEELAQIAREKLKNGTKIDGFMLISLRWAIAKQIVDGDFNLFGWHSETLSRHTSALYTHGLKLEEMTPKEAFAVGAIYGMLGVEKEVCEEPERQAEYQKQFEYIKDNLDIFKFIRQAEPFGASASDLAEHTGESKSNCSKLLRNLQNSRLLVSSIDLEPVSDGYFIKVYYYHTSYKTEVFMDSFDAKDENDIRSILADFELRKGYGQANIKGRCEVAWKDFQAAQFDENDSLFNDWQGFKAGTKKEEILFVFNRLYFPHGGVDNLRQITESEK